MNGKLTKKQLKVREFILKIFRKEIKITTPIFKKFVKIMADSDNAIIVEKYGERLYSSLLSEYKFKNQDDYQEKINMLLITEYSNSGFTQFASFHNTIIKKLFDSETVKTEWIIEILGNSSSFLVKRILAYIFLREKDLSPIINNILQITQYTKNEELVATIIIENALEGKFRDEELIASILEIELKKPSNELIVGVKRQLEESKAIKPIKTTISLWIYEHTNDIEYLPQEVKDIFVF